MLNRIKAFLLAAVLLMAGSLRAEDPPSSALRQFINFKDSKGLYDYYKPEWNPEESAQIANNLDYSINGTLRPRRAIVGISQLSNIGQSGDLTGPRDNGFWIYKSTNNLGYFIARIEDEFGYQNIETLTTNPVGQGSTRFVQRFRRGLMDALQDGNTFYVVSESTPIISISESASTGTLKMNYITGSPSGAILKQHLDTFLVAGSTIIGNEDTVFFSSPNYILTWPAVNFFEIFARANEYISCIGDPIYGNVPLYTNQTVRLITGTEYPSQISAGNIVVRLIYDGIGCASQKSVKNLNNVQYFFSSGQGGKIPGIYAFNGVSVKEKTKPIRRFFRDVVQNSTATRAQAYVYQNQYCLNVATNGFDRLNTVICIDEMDRIWMYRPFTASMMADYNGVYYFHSWSDAMFPGDVAGGLHNFDVMRYDQNDGYDTLTANDPKPSLPISWRYKTKDFTMGKDQEQNANRTKWPDRLYIKTEVSSYTVRNSSISFVVQANYDFGKSSTQWLIDLSTIYTSGNIVTVSSGSNALINKLFFPKGAEFTTINFEVSGSTKVVVDYLDFYALPQSLR